MTVDPNSIDLPTFMAEHLQRAEPDLLRTMLSTFVQALMSAEANASCGARMASAARSDQLPQRPPDPGLRHPHRHHGGRCPSRAG